MYLISYSNSLNPFDYISNNYFLISYLDSKRKKIRVTSDPLNSKSMNLMTSHDISLIFKHL
jgi:hypothetical protein